MQVFEEVLADNPNSEAIAESDEQSMTRLHFFQEGLRRMSSQEQVSTWSIPGSYLPSSLILPALLFVCS